VDELLSIGDVSQRSGVAASALRFYEDRGLIAAHRASSGHRLYPRWTLRQVAFIVFAQRVGFSLDEIGEELAKLPDGRAPARSDWSKLSHLWLARIDERIDELKRLRKGLTVCIGCGCLSLPACRFANPNDKMGREGPGPRNWVRRK
jgi:MerR family transcriptional regulator, redox-sensitive transcriptional activator SoxR